MAEHGTDSRYNNEGCRCDLCRAVHSAEMRTYRRKGVVPASAEHGLKSTYDNHKCRCQDCRAANAAFQRRYAQQRGKDGG